MTSAGKWHLYTFWNPNLFPDTIEDHISILSRECAVKWIILYGDQTWLVEKGKPLNMRALLRGNIIFKGIIGDKEVCMINEQAKEDETLLFMQCLNIFHKPLYVRKIKRMEIISKDGIKPLDPLIPDHYYHDVITERGLRPYYSITLTDIKEVQLLEMCNLIPESKFQSEKFPFPYPMLVTQRKPKLFFENVASPKIDKIEIVYANEPVSGRLCWHVKQPNSLDPRKTMTLGIVRQLYLLRCFEGHESYTMKVGTIANDIYKSRRIKKSTTAKNNKSKSAQYVQNLITNINKAFKKHYDRDLIQLGRGKYKLLANKITISQKT